MLLKFINFFLYSLLFFFRKLNTVKHSADKCGNISVIKVFDLTAATTGINETNARKAGLNVDKVILSPMSHAGYYPGGMLMTMKVIFEVFWITIIIFDYSSCKVANKKHYFLC